MKNLNHLVKKLLGGKTITLFYNRYNDGSEENPDITIDHLFAEIETSETYKDIVIKLSKENDETIWDTYEVYRIPYLTNFKILKSILKEATKQSHN
ncbi:MAG: hypothetical protein Q7S33_04660 [Nanoarchaeota archaeon]|nr:hypothetical protein [Nanoarchaeota archaeon]